MFDSRQIRPPIYSLKQTKLRKRRVIRYAILYFAMLVLFVVLIAAPLVVRRLNINIPTLPMFLMQPSNQNNNDTSTSITGSHLPQGMQDSVPTGSATSGGAKMMFAF